MGNTRKPVPAGGQPTPATIAGADGTPPATATPPAPAVPQDAAPADQNGDPTPDAGKGGDDGQDGGALVDARVLVAYGDHQPDDVVTDTRDAIEQMKLDGRADPHPDAVAYARSLQA
jgi:hypothetical protein